MSGETGSICALFEQRLVADLSFIFGFTSLWHLVDWWSSSSTPSLSEEIIQA